MANENKYIELKGSAYRVRILACLAVAELIFLGIFNLWPLTKASNNSHQDVSFSEKAVDINDVVMTRQESRPPPPPRPQAPVPVPNDKVIEDKIVNLDIVNNSDFSDSLSMQTVGENGNSDRVVGNPETSPQVIRIVEPTEPDAAREANIKAEIWVNFLVNKEGRVEDANISKINIFNRKTGKSQIVQSIGYGLTEATLEAALEWQFRPAKNNGKPVKAYSTQIFTYGFNH
ncbi:MAG TPA: energy transducer TonB [Balneolaceae bacterium]|nr:energy transducer TonB [Balneolaceae bacterium]